MNNARNHPGFIYDKIIRRNVALPSYVFSQKFDKYVFFDLDLATSSILLSGLSGLLEASGVAAEQFTIFSVTNGEILATVPEDAKWPTSVLRVGKGIREKNDCNGIIILPASQAWVVFQSRPVDLGVLAINDRARISREMIEASGCFFDCTDVARWLNGLSPDDAEMRSDIGKPFLAALKVNYCPGRV